MGGGFAGIGERGPLNFITIKRKLLPQIAAFVEGSIFIPFLNLVIMKKSPFLNFLVFVTTCKDCSLILEQFILASQIVITIKPVMCS